LKIPKHIVIFFRISKEQFFYIVNIVRPSLEKKAQPFPINLVRSDVSVDKRVAVTLRFLATGESFHSLEYSFRITRQHISDMFVCLCFGPLRHLDLESRDR
jgi:hypothetical protein